MNNRIASGRNAKLGGHLFEHKLSEYLSIKNNDEHEVFGGSRTKIDIQNKSGTKRYSVKNPSGRNTQISLITQKNFIEAFNITDTSIITFIEKFFGGNKYSCYDRHRLCNSEISIIESNKFVEFLNNNGDKLYDLLFVKGYKQSGNVNYLAWATLKDDVNSIAIIDLEYLKTIYLGGHWTTNETTLCYFVNNKKLLHLQMKGSGTKYSSGYHSLQFHLYNTFI